jgi:serine/threonine-protein kinase
VLDRLGEGAMGEVYKARLRNSRDIAVLKVVRTGLATQGDTAAQLLGEMKALAHLSHPNVIRTFGAYASNNKHFFAMEYLEGTDLGRLVQQSGPLPCGQACDYIRQAAMGLEHAHEHCLVHRDIKPANLLLTLAREATSKPNSGAVVKIIDWGVADRRIPTKEGELTDSKVRKEIVGTADYLAPEQAETPAAASIRADIYSLGCTLYHLLTGQPPFPGGSLLQKLVKHQQAQPRPISELRSDVPASLAAIAAKMMAKRPEERYRTPSAVAAALAPYCRGE